jgi:Transposase IS66 family/OsmC-like protein
MTATAGISTTVRAKEFHFPVTVDWLGERRVAARVEGKPTIEVTPPPVFRGTDPSTWSPEDFFVAAAASCLAVTFTGLAVRAGLAYTRLTVDVEQIRTQMRPLLEWGSTGKRQRHVHALAKNLLKLWPALWTFAETPDVEPTNNAAERGLRAAVIYRKLSLGSRSQGGERTIERLLPVDQDLPAATPFALRLPRRRAQRQGAWRPGSQPRLRSGQALPRTQRC